MTHTKSRLFGMAGLLAAVLFSALPVAAQEAFPTKPINIIVPYAPGGGGDVYSRVLQPFLEKELGVSTTIENIPGAGGIVGQTAGINAPSDGYTMVLWSSPSNELNAITSETEFEVTDFVGLGAAAPGETIIAVPTDRPWKTLNELIADMKARLGVITVGGIGPFGTGGVAYAEMIRHLGIDGRWVPFPGTAEITTAVLGGHVDVALIGGSENRFVDLMKSGEFKILAVLSDKLVGPYAAANLPTVLSETGISIVHEVQRGHVVRADTPPERLAFLRDAYSRATQNPEFIKLIEEKVGPYGYLDGEQFTDILHNGTAALQELMPILNELAGN